MLVSERKPMSTAWEWLSLYTAYRVLCDFAALGDLHGRA